MTTRSCLMPTPAPLSAKLLKNGTLKTYKDFPHGMPTTAGRDHQRRPAGLHQRLEPVGISSAGIWFRHSRLVA